MAGSTRCRALNITGGQRDTGLMDRRSAPPHDVQETSDASSN
jgi:hypothetical protein